MIPPADPRTGYSTNSSPTNAGHIRQASDDSLGGVKAAPRQSITTVESSGSQSSSAIWGEWRTEILLAILSVIFMALTIMVLVISDHKPLDYWPAKITPNTLLSIFLTLSQASMASILSQGVSQLKWSYFQQQQHPLIDYQIFDDASRGAMGSVLLLSKLRFRPSLASAGAAITVLALAMGPFAQQVIQTQIALRLSDDGVASLPVASAFDDGVPLSNDNSFVTLFASSDILSNLTSAMFSGMFATSLDPPYECTTGNCTWTNYSTIAICSQCQNVTLTTDVLCESEAERMSAANAQDTCNYTLPGGVQLSGSTILYAGPEEGTFVETLLNSTVTISEDYMQANFANISVVRFPKVSDEWYGMPNVAAYQCAMSWCQQSYEDGIVFNGKWIPSPPKTQMLEFPNCTLIPGETGNVCPGYPMGQAQSNSSALNSTSTNSTTSPIVQLNRNDYVTIQKWFNAMFNVSTDTLDNVEPNTVLPNVLANTLWQLNDGNISQTLTDVASTISHMLRQGPNSTNIAGTSLRPIVVVSVRWEWLTLPACLVLAAIVFLALAITSSTRQRSVVWKSSALAGMFHGIDGWSPDDAEWETRNEMELQAKKMKVILQRDAGGRVAFYR